MAIDRRSFLLTSLAAVAAPAGWRNAAAAVLPAFIAAARKGDGAFAILLLDSQGQILREVALSARGHDIALYPQTGRAVAFARRPGTFAVAFDLEGTRAPLVFNAIAGRHFYGHGAFSADGRLLYVSENDIANARGVIGIYDVEAGYRRLGEMPSHGVGPHEIIRLPDGKTIAVANGGIDTVPEAGRENLNLDTMQPSLAFVDAATGALKARHELSSDLSRLSIRHIASDATGQVWFGGQWEGDASATPELIGRAGVDSALKLIAPSAPLGTALKGYIGSVSASRDGRIIAASAPKAGRILYLSATDGALLGDSVLKDGCGVAGDAGGDFAVTSGLGAFRHETARAEVLSEAQLAEISFDNHLRRIG